MNDAIADAFPGGHVAVTTSGAYFAGADDLNEPETSLHPDLLLALARLIVQASKQTQMIVVSHAKALVSALDADPDSRQIVLEKSLGETVVQDHEPPSWTWPSR